MGMDLDPINDNKTDLHYNWNGWSWLTERLIEWGVDVSEFTGYNDGDVISAATCRKVGDAIEAHIEEIEERHQVWLSPHIERWRTSGGFRQF